MAKVRNGGAVSEALLGRQDPVTNGRYLASELSGSNSAAKLQESTRTRCPLLTVAKTGSGRSPGMRKSSKPPFVMR